MQQIHNYGKQGSKCHLLPLTLTLAALSTKVTTGYGSVEISRKRLRPIELSWWRITNFALLHNTLLHGADKVFPAKQSTNPNTIQSSGNTGERKATTSQKPSNKTTTMSSVTDVKGLLQVTELQLVSSSGLDIKALVLCDNACSNSWVAGSLADRLSLHGKALKLTVKGINTEEVIDTRVVENTETKRTSRFRTIYH